MRVAVGGVGKAWCGAWGLGSRDPSGERVTHVGRNKRVMHVGHTTLRVKECWSLRV